MVKNNDDKWLDEIIFKSINTEKPQFDAGKFRQKFPNELAALQSRANKQTANPDRWTNIIKSPITKLAAAAVIIIGVSLSIIVTFQQSPTEQPPVIDVTANDEISQTDTTSEFPTNYNSEMAMTAGTVRAFNPDEVCLDKNLDGEKVYLKYENGTLFIGKGLNWYFAGAQNIILNGREYLAFRQEDALVYVSINQGPKELIGVYIRTIDDLQDLHYALLVSEKPLALWSDIQPPMEIADLPNLEKITSFQQMDPNQLTDMLPLAFLPNLEWIYVYKQHEVCLGIDDISALANLNALKILVLREFHNLHEINSLGTNLKVLDLTGACNLRNINFLRNNKILEILKLNSCNYISDISPLENLTALSYLDLFGCKFSDLSPLSNLSNLSYLNICGCEAADLRPLSNLKNLYYLNLGANEKLSDISPIAGLENLKELDLWVCHNLSNIEPISNLNRLRVLNLRGCDNITDLSPLSELQYLITLDCLGCKKLTDISPIADLRNLARVNLTLCPEITDLMQIKPLIARDAEIYVSDDLKELLSAIKEEAFYELIDKSSAIIQVEILECTNTEEGGRLVRSEWKARKTNALYRDVSETEMILVWDMPNPRLVEFERGRYAIVFLTEEEDGTYSIIHARTALFNEQEEKIIQARDEQDYKPEN